MTTQNKSNGQEKEKITALYCRLSVDDDKKDMESHSITNQNRFYWTTLKKVWVSAPGFLCRRRHFRDNLSKAGFSADAENGGERRGRDDHRKGCFPLWP